VSDLAVADAARAAARRLGPQLGCAGLEVEVEAALHRHGAAGRQDSYVDVVALGSLIVSIAALAYQVYNDHRKQQGRRPRRSTLVRIIRVRRQEPGGLMAAEETIIEVVAAEIIKAAGDDE
jgi:uncharacterized membrane protein YebE (DUF533 family)